MMKSILPRNKCCFIVCIILAFSGVSAFAQSPFGEKSTWHGFDRYDFVMDEKTLELTPITKTEEEGTEVKAPEKGSRRCVVVVPKEVAPGKPWTWRGCYWDHEPQAEIELLKKGFHVAYITTNPDETWDAWYQFLTGNMGLSAKPSFIGMSRGGSNAYTWGTAHPDKVTAIYVDNPGLSHQSLMGMDKLAENNVPLLHICGSIDPIFENTVNIERLYKANGGSISVLVKDGPSHHPHSLRDPNIVADFIEKSVAAKAEVIPAFIPENHTKTAFYSDKEVYEYMPSEKVWISTRGPVFAPKYNKYTFRLQRGLNYLSVYTPVKAAAGMPWVYRCDHPTGLSAVDLALLEKGFHIVVGPTTTSTGPVLEQWNEFYNYLVDKGFSKKPVLAGCGAATGEMYVWGINNPDKVACIYGENPIMRSSVAEVQPMDDLKPLADAKVSLIHVCGSLDPNLDSQTREVEKRYRSLGGSITVFIDEGRGHYPLSPNNPDDVVDAILKFVPAGL